MTITANPTLTSAAATTMIKNTKICASIPACGLVAPSAWNCIFEKATSNRFTEFNISSTHMKIIMAFRRVSTPATPMQNNATDKKI